MPIQTWEGLISLVEKKTNRKATWVENVCGLIMFTVMEGHGSFVGVELFWFLIVGLIRVMWVLLIGWNMMLQHFSCHWGHFHEKFSRGERHQLILSQLFSRDALWQLPWHPVTRRDQRLAMEPDSCELTSNEKRERLAALRRSLSKVRKWSSNLRAELPSQPSSTTTCSSKNHPALIVPCLITPHHHIEHRKKLPTAFPIIQPRALSQNRSYQGKLGLLLGWLAGRVAAFLAGFIFAKPEPLENSSSQRSACNQQKYTK